MGITDEDLILEGFPDFTRWEFVDFFREHMRCNFTDMVTRIEWRYL